MTVNREEIKGSKTGQPNRPMNVNGNAANLHFFTWPKADIGKNKNPMPYMKLYIQGPWAPEEFQSWTDLHPNKANPESSEDEEPQASADTGVVSRRRRFSHSFALMRQSLPTLERTAHRTPSDDEIDAQEGTGEGPKAKHAHRRGHGGPGGRR